MDNSSGFIVILDILGIGRVPVSVRPDECVRELRSRLHLEPGLRLLHEGQLLKETAQVPIGSSILLAPAMVGGGNSSDGGEKMMGARDSVADTNTVQDPVSAPQADGTKTPPPGILSQPIEIPKQPIQSQSQSASASLGKSRCNTSGCCDRPARIIGDCRYCHGHYCSKHRLPEAHTCDRMEHCRQESFEKNSDRLRQGKCVADKM